MGSDPPSSTRRADYSLAAGDGFDATHKQFNVDQFVLQDGRTYRTQEANQELQKSCTLLGDASLAFGVNHAACIMSKENNGWKPTRVASSTTSRTPVWSTATAGFGIGWTMTQEASSAST